MFISFVVDLIRLSKDNICQSKRHFVVVKLQHDAMDPVTIPMLIFPTHGAPSSRRNVSTIQSKWMHLEPNITLLSHSSRQIESLTLKTTEASS